MTGWLTRIALNTRSRLVGSDLADIVAMHRRLMSLFPDDLGDLARAQLGLLFRIDTLRSGAVTVLAQSKSQPDLDRLPDRYGTCDQRPLGPMLDALVVGLPARYRLAANASKRVWDADDRHPRGTIVGLGREDAEQWWCQRAKERYGLDLTSVIVESADPVRGKRDRARVTHAVTHFDGTATITDPQALREAVLTGIGRGKAYGCGLLSLAPVRT